jgi:hypothetical protein
VSLGDFAPVPSRVKQEGRWEVERYPAAEYALSFREVWHLSDGRKHACILVEMTGRVSWCARRRGEVAVWQDPPHNMLENAKCLAEIALDEMPYVGPLEAP